MLHAVFGESISPISREFLEQQPGVPADPGVPLEDDDDAESEDAWVSCTGAFTPFLRLVDELVCSCAVVGESPPGPFTGESLVLLETLASSPWGLIGPRFVVPPPASGAERELVLVRLRGVPFHELEACAGYGRIWRNRFGFPTRVACALIGLRSASEGASRGCPLCFISAASRSGAVLSRGGTPTDDEHAAKCMKPHFWGRRASECIVVHESK